MEMKKNRWEKREEKIDSLNINILHNYIKRVETREVELLGQKAERKRAKEITEKLILIYIIKLLSFI